jgi:hypothetical protein
LVPPRRNVMSPLAAIPIAALMATEWIGIPIRRSLLRHGPRLTAFRGKPPRGDGLLTHLFED